MIYVDVIFDSDVKTFVIQSKNSSMCRLMSFKRCNVINFHIMCNTLHSKDTVVSNSVENLKDNHITVTIRGKFHVVRGR